MPHGLAMALLLTPVVWPCIADEVDTALAIQRNVFVAMFGKCDETHLTKHISHRLEVWCRIFNKFKTVGA